MSIKRTMIANLMGCGCIAALLPTMAFAQDAAPRSSSEEAEGIVVTGSRIITNGNNSPTPVTAITTEQLQTTTPGNIYDALQKLPAFLPSGGQRVASNGGTNGSGNYLNLRSLGSQRLLVLLDGHRLPPTSSDGSIDTNILPQMLLKRVDVVTGGASAVYGSDAVSGVVNFIIDPKFNGVKVQVQKGISQRGDNPTFRAGLAAGTELFGGRGHIEGSFEHYQAGGLGSPWDRKYGVDRCTLGGGTVAQPYQVKLSNCRNGRPSFGGSFLNGGPLTGTVFNADRQLVPFIPGRQVPPSAIVIGGDGAYNDPSLLADLNTDQAFGRFDFDVSDDIHFYLQGSYADSRNSNDYGYVFVSNQRVNRDNPFLRSKLSAAQLAVIDGSTATFSNFFKNVTEAPEFVVTSKTKNIMAQAGLNGSLAGFRWDIAYIYGQNKQNQANPNNVNVAKYLDGTD